MKQAARLITVFLLLSGSSAAIKAQSDMVSLEHGRGDRLFQEKCGMCHRAGGMGTGILARRLSPEQALLENRADLSSALIETAVRNGFGIMFPMSRAEVSDQQLATITNYLTDADGNSP